LYCPALPPSIHHLAEALPPAGSTQNHSNPALPCLAAFATSIKRARQLGGLTGFVHGTSAAGDSAAQGTMRMFEQIIE